MNAIALLKKQHAAVKNLFTQFAKTEDPHRQQAIFEEVADNLAAHCVIEEKLFYPAAFGAETADLLEEAVEEHLSAKRLIADLLKMSPDERQYVAKVTVLSEIIGHHVKEEHDDLFPSVREVLSAREFGTLGTHMEELFDSLMKSSPRLLVPRQTAEAAVLPDQACPDEPPELRASA